MIAPRRVPLSVVILAFNEEDKLPGAIASVAWAGEIIVVDSGSTDRTAAVATEHGARVVQVPFQGFGHLRNESIRTCSHEWIFTLDADERCTPGCRAEIEAILEAPAVQDAYLVPRRNEFFGRAIRHSGWYPNYRQPQLFRRGRLSYPPEDLVHEGYRLPSGRLGRLRHPIRQIPYRNLGEALRKMDRYSGLSARKLLEQGRPGGVARGFLRGLWSFFRLYFLRLGCLDGSAGLIIAVLAFENSFYKHVKRRELDLPDPLADPPA